MYPSMHPPILDWHKRICSIPSLKLALLWYRLVLLLFAISDERVVEVVRVVGGIFVDGIFVDEVCCKLFACWITKQRMGGLL